MSSREPENQPVKEIGVIELRPATPADALAITALLHELGYPSNTDDEVSDRLTRWSERDDLLVSVATKEQQVVGVIALAVIPYFERPGNWGRIVALVVDTHVREQGLGRRLLADAEQAALARGCVAMEISSARRRVDAHAFYSSQGYVDRCDESAKFRKDLLKHYGNPPEGAAAPLAAGPGAEGLWISS